jgi:hypothetical protein
LVRPFRSSIIRAVWAPVRPLALLCFEYFEYELLTHRAAAPEMSMPTTIISM